jgi:hypothetical protein
VLRVDGDSDDGCFHGGRHDTDVSPLTPLCDSGTVIRGFATVGGVVSVSLRVKLVELAQSFGGASPGSVEEVPV